MALCNGGLGWTCLHEVFPHIAENGPDSLFTYAVGDGQYRWYVQSEGHFGLISPDFKFRFVQLRASLCLAYNGFFLFLRL